MNRIYQNVLEEHFSLHRQMAFLSGPRQVGKTTLLQSLPEKLYFNWDDPADRRIFLTGADALAKNFDLDRMRAGKPLIAFDEIHKYARWKNTLKGFFDKYGTRAKIAVTGSAKLDFYKRSGDSLRGRYLNYRVHPLSIGELEGAPLKDHFLRAPKKISGDTLAQLLQFGGFPEPFLKASSRFHRQWSRLQRDQILREELRDLAAVREISQPDALGTFLAEQAAGVVNYSSLAKMLQASVDSIRRWSELLETLYFCFFVRPYSKNITRSLVKEPKVYLWDWSSASDAGARLENLVAEHLQKAVHYWTDTGVGEFALHFLRDKEKREVDFLVTRDRKPWFLAEVKSSGSEPLSPALAHFQNETKAPHAWQVAADLPATGGDCFAYKTPIKIPLADLLARLP